MSVLYEGGGIVITTDQAILPGATYRIAAIQAVGKRPLPEQAGWALLAAGLPGLLFLAAGVAGFPEGVHGLKVFPTIALAVLLLGLALGGGVRLWRAPAARYVLMVSIGGKPEPVLVTEDEDVIDAVRAALEQAMAHRPPAVETRFREPGSHPRAPLA